ncbi:hypothetical protein AC792_12360 [Arthrobacter sp. RIT-PI-e]|uniref:hypothetical protein n=1 Tax=Arthrobacter sp. RIT-PI-e TaxID=1681197 RepID=UPI0006764333|nr:hypothetical protein [Arthrobacter sp. RIT-PI-e]KNC18417.1 hypothetical protein AC792_12360 [Arthrobacter sp. RIT-PI-e]
MTAVATPATTRILDLAALTEGTVVEARRRGQVYYRGRVEDTVPALGILWIRDDLAGHRALLDLTEFSIWHVVD